MKNNNQEKATGELEELVLWLYEKCKKAKSKGEIEGLVLTTGLSPLEFRLSVQAFELLPVLYSQIYFNKTTHGEIK